MPNAVVHIKPVQIDKMVVKYSPADKDMFIRILRNYPILEDKRTDAYSIQKKKAAWEKLVVDYNAATTEKRTIIQLKRLWDKIKRSRKSRLREERHEMSANGGPIKQPPTSLPEIDNVISQLKYEIDTDADSDDMYFIRKSEVEHITQEVTSGISDVNPSPVTHEQDTSISPGPSYVADINPVPDSPKRSHLYDITEARLQLIKKEELQMEELHKVRMEEANYRKEAARLVMLQEEAKLKQIQNN